MRAHKITDKQLRDHQANGTQAVDIARIHDMSEAGVSQRLKRLEQAPVPLNPVILDQVQSSVWDVQRGLEENYARCMALLDAPLVDSIKVIAELRAHLKFGMDVLTTMYNVQEVQAFQAEVLDVLESCEPGLRNQILTALDRRRALRAAFIRRPDTLPDI